MCCSLRCAEVIQPWQPQQPAQQSKTSAAHPVHLRSRPVDSGAPPAARGKRRALHCPGMLAARRAGCRSLQRHPLFESRQLQRAHRLVGATYDCHEANGARLCLLELQIMVAKAAATMALLMLLLLHSCCEADGLRPTPHAAARTSRPTANKLTCIDVMWDRKEARWMLLPYALMLRLFRHVCRTHLWHAERRSSWLSSGLAAGASSQRCFRERSQAGPKIDCTDTEAASAADQGAAAAAPAGIGAHVRRSVAALRKADHAPAARPVGGGSRTAYI
jgi:hypothetical protein